MSNEKTKVTKSSLPNEKETPKTAQNIKKAEESTAKTKKPVYRVLYDKDTRFWLIKKDGAKRTIASFPTKDEALSRVKELSSSNDLNFVVHKKDGKFQKK